MLDHRFLNSILDSVEEHIAVIDRGGQIKYVNHAWINFGDCNGGAVASGTWGEINYLEACEASAQGGDLDSGITLAGFELVASGEQEEFYHEYPCHSPDEQRWYMMRIAPLQHEELLFVVTHKNITERKLAENTVEALSRMDALTGLANRRHFDETFDREWRRCERSGKSLAVIMLDIDHFKLFNDGYGHQAGDDCLQAVAGVLVEAAQRPFDIAARYGGEEFVVILPETDMAAARRIAEKIVSGVMALNIPHAYSSVAESVTISAGVSAALPGNELACADLLRTADEALYKTKHTSRNGLTCKLQPRAA